MNKIQVSAEELVERFDEMLDSGYNEAVVLGYSFRPCKILKECDPIAYRVGLADFADTLSKCGFEVEGY